MNDDRTSLITILSSDHGRLRREQRDIRKRDLQKALKYGSVSPAWNDRYKVVHEGIVFITDVTRRREVTCFPAPLDLVPVDFKAYADHDGAKHVLLMKPKECTSHTVLVVDTSGSMKTHDILLHRDRQVAAYTTMALEYIAEQLFQETSNNRDAVSLIEFNRDAQVIFKREPVSWVTFNKMLNRRGLEHLHVNRESSRLRDAVYDESNYLPALDAAERLLEVGFHEDCALSLFFLSDGQPTDAGHQGLTPQGALRRMQEVVGRIASRFVDQMNMTFVGFGNSCLDFSSLESITKAANEAAGRTIAKFVFCDKLAHTVGVAVSDLASSTTLTKTAMVNGERLLKKNRRTDFSPEQSVASFDWKFFRILMQAVYDPAVDNWVHYGGLPPGALREENIIEAKSRLDGNRLPPFLAMNKHSLGTGVERVAFRCHLADAPYPNSFQLGSMVAKETIRADLIEERIAFHKSHCETQSLAAHLADQFNKTLFGLWQFRRYTAPRVTFLKCSILVLADPSWPGGKRGVLVEKQLDTGRFEWRKWNDNFGGVDGQRRHLPMDVDYELNQLDLKLLNLELRGAPSNAGMLVIEEGSEDEESDEENDNYNHLVENLVMEDSGIGFRPSDYLQAFSHFSYLFSNKKLLVCDLQGVYNTDIMPPTFELSDPAIHYRSKSNKRMVYGRTDKGEDGIKKFFGTHKCTGICKILELSQKKKKWRKEWHRDFAEDMRNNFGY